MSFVLLPESAGPIVLTPLSFTFRFSRQCLFLRCHPDSESCVVEFGAVSFWGGAEKVSAMTYSGKAAGNEPGVFEWAFLAERLRAKRSVHRPDINRLLPPTW